MRLLGLGKSLPKKIVSNDQLSKIIDTTDEWIFQRTGIKERRISDKNTSELAYEAAEAAIKNANINKDEIDLIICATITPDNFTPSVACMVQERLDIKSNVTAFDINAACSGFIYALKVAASLLETFHKKALVIGCETMSKIIDFKDRTTCILFGDGAGAAIFEKDDKLGCFYTRSLGLEEHIYAPAYELNSEMNEKNSPKKYMTMNGKEVFRFAISSMQDGITSILEKTNIKQEEIKLFIPHQANIRIIHTVAKKLNIPKEKFFTNLEKYGNTSGASVILALCEAFEQKVIKKGDLVMLLGFGAGLTWGSTIIEI